MPVSQHILRVILSFKCEHKASKSKDLSINQLPNEGIYQHKNKPEHFNNFKLQKYIAV